MPKRVARKLIQRYWRMTRGLTLGVRGIILDPEGRMLLVKHTYTAGWHFPGGGVEFGETVEIALTRELIEEAGIAMTRPPELLGIYSNAELFPGDHVVVFTIRQWEQHRPLAPNREIAEAGFFAPDVLPEGTTPGTRRRIDELHRRSAIQPLW